MKTKTIKNKIVKEHYALEFLKTMKDGDGFVSYKKGDLYFDPRKDILDGLIKEGRSGYYSGHDFMLLTKSEVRIRKFKIVTTTVQKRTELKCDKKVK
jgi:hypothetical protein